jgi:hypothetical protein
MLRKVFFSFDFTRNASRVAQIRNAHVVCDYDKPPFLEVAEWEKVKSKDDGAHT